MPRPTFLQTILGRPSQSYSTYNPSDNASSSYPSDLPSASDRSTSLVLSRPPSETSTAPGVPGTTKRRRGLLRRKASNSSHFSDRHTSPRSHADSESGLGAPAPTTSFSDVPLSTPNHHAGFSLFGSRRKKNSKSAVPDHYAGAGLVRNVVLAPDTPPSSASSHPHPPPHAHVLAPPTALVPPFVSDDGHLLHRSHSQSHSPSSPNGQHRTAHARSPSAASSSMSHPLSERKRTSTSDWAAFVASMEARGVHFGRVGSSSSPSCPEAADPWPSARSRTTSMPLATLGGDGRQPDLVRRRRTLVERVRRELAEEEEASSDRRRSLSVVGHPSSSPSAVGVGVGAGAGADADAGFDPHSHSRSGQRLRRRTASHGNADDVAKAHRDVFRAQFTGGRSRSMIARPAADVAAGPPSSRGRGRFAAEACEDRPLPPLPEGANALKPAFRNDLLVLKPQPLRTTSAAHAHAKEAPHVGSRPMVAVPAASASASVAERASASSASQTGSESESEASTEEEEEKKKEEGHDGERDEESTGEDEDEGVPSRVYAKSAPAEDGESASSSSTGSVSPASVSAKDEAKSTGLVIVASAPPDPDPDSDSGSGSDRGSSSSDLEEEEEEAHLARPPDLDTLVEASEDGSSIGHEMRPASRAFMGPRRKAERSSSRPGRPPSRSIDDGGGTRRGAKVEDVQQRVSSSAPLQLLLSLITTDEPNLDETPSTPTASTATPTQSNADARSDTDSASAAAAAVAGDRSPSLVHRLSNLSLGTDFADALVPAPGRASSDSESTPRQKESSADGPFPDGSDKVVVASGRRLVDKMERQGSVGQNVVFSVSAAAAAVPGSALNVDDDDHSKPGTESTTTLPSPPHGFFGPSLSDIFAHYDPDKGLSEEQKAQLLRWRKHEEGRFVPAGGGGGGEEGLGRRLAERWLAADRREFDFGSQRAPSPGSEKEAVEAPADAGAVPMAPSLPFRTGEFSDANDPTRRPPSRPSSIIADIFEGGLFGSDARSIDLAFPELDLEALRQRVRDEEEASRAEFGSSDDDEALGEGVGVGVGVGVGDAGEGEDDEGEATEVERGESGRDKRRVFESEAEDAETETEGGAVAKWRSEKGKGPAGHEVSAIPASEGFDIPYSQTFSGRDGESGEADSVDEDKDIEREVEMLTRRLAELQAKREAKRATRASARTAVGAVEVSNKAAASPSSSPAAPEPMSRNLSGTSTNSFRTAPSVSSPFVPTWPVDDEGADADNDGEDGEDGEGDGMPGDFPSSSKALLGLSRSASASSTRSTRRRSGRTGASKRRSPRPRSLEGNGLGPDSAASASSALASPFSEDSRARGDVQRRDAIAEDSDEVDQGSACWRTPLQSPDSDDRTDLAWTPRARSPRKDIRREHSLSHRRVDDAQGRMHLSSSELEPASASIVSERTVVGPVSPVTADSNNADTERLSAAGDEAPSENSHTAGGAVTPLPPSPPPLQSRHRTPLDANSAPSNDPVAPAPSEALPMSPMSDASNVSSSSPLFSPVVQAREMDGERRRRSPDNDGSDLSTSSTSMTSSYGSEVVTSPSKTFAHLKETYAPPVPPKSQPFPSPPMIAEEEERDRALETIPTTAPITSRAQAIGSPSPVTGIDVNLIPPTPPSLVHVNSYTRVQPAQQVPEEVPPVAPVPAPPKMIKPASSGSPEGTSSAKVKRSSSMSSKPRTIVIPESDSGLTRSLSVSSAPGLKSKRKSVRRSGMPEDWKKDVLQLGPSVTVNSLAASRPSSTARASESIKKTKKVKKPSEARGNGGAGADERAMESAIAPRRRTLSSPTHPTASGRNTAEARPPLPPSRVQRSLSLRSAASSGILSQPRSILKKPTSAFPEHVEQGITTSGAEHQMTDEERGPYRTPSPRRAPSSGSFYSHHSHSPSVDSAVNSHARPVSFPPSEPYQRPSLMSAIANWEEEAARGAFDHPDAVPPRPSVSDPSRTPSPYRGSTAASSSLMQSQSPSIVRMSHMGAPASHFLKPPSPAVHPRAMPPELGEGGGGPRWPTSLRSFPTSLTSFDGQSSDGRYSVMSVPTAGYRPRDPRRLSGDLDDVLLGRTTMATLSISSHAFRSASSDRPKPRVPSHRRKRSITSASSSDLPSHLADKLDKTQMSVSAHMPPPRKLATKQVLVAVLAVAIDEFDRLIIHERTTKHDNAHGFVPGRSFCGRVLETGWEVDRVRKGDIVFGLQDSKKCGALAEYLSIDHNLLAPAPTTLSIEQISALPTTGVLAYQIIKNHCSELPRGARVFILNAHDGVGLLVMQAAAHLGILITAHCPASVADGLSVCEANGAHEVVIGDALWALNSQHESSFDLVIDTVGGRRIYDASRRILASEGHFSTCFGDEHTTAQPTFRSHFRSLRRAFFKKDKKNIGYEWITCDAKEDTREALERIAEAVQNGRICPRLRSIIPFGDAPRAFEPHPHGKEEEDAGAIVIKING